MIAIDSSNFDWDTISALYGYDEATGHGGAVVQSVAKRLNDVVDKGNELTVAVFRKWFYDHDKISEKRISEFLLRADTASLIEEYAKTICREKWKKGELYLVFLRYKVAFEKAARLDDKGERLDYLLSFLKESGVTPRELCRDLRMFKTKTKSGSSAHKYRFIGKADFDSPVQTNSLCNSKDRLRNTQLTIDGEIRNFFKDCSTVFNYESFSKGHRDTILNAMRIDVCPYCNRQYISRFRDVGKDSKSKRSTADIDHFYSQSQYPFLALSLYNFVPSCQICNSRFKLADDFYGLRHVNPHEKGFGSRARFEIRGIDALIDLNCSPEISLCCDMGSEDIANSIKTFRLDELYENHTDYVRELIIKARVFSASQIKEYLEEYGTLFSSSNELYGIIYGNYLDEEEVGKRPLAKLTQDILLDLGVLPFE